MKYCTSFCNHAHRVSDGKPVAHECYVLPPAALAAERRGDFREALQHIAEARPLKTHRGVRKP